MHELEKISSGSPLAGEMLPFAAKYLEMELIGRLNRTARLNAYRNMEDVPCIEEF